MALTNALFNTGLTAMVSELDSVSLHSDDPGTTGTNEISGGSYARQTPAWDVPASGAVEITASLEFSIPGGNDVAWVGLWDSTGPTWKGGIQLNNAESFSGDGTFTLSAMDITLTNA